MPIIFEEIETVVITADGDLRLYLTIQGQQLEIPPGTGIGDVTWLLSLDGTGEEFEAVDVDPPIPTTGDLNIQLSLDGEGYEIVQGDGEIGVPLRIDGFSGDGFGEVSITLTIDGRENPPLTAYGFLSMQPFQIIAYAGFSSDTYVSGVGFTSGDEIDIVLLLQSLMTLNAEDAWINRLHMTLESSITAQAIFTVLLEASFNDALALTDTPETVLLQIISLADQLVLTAEVPVLMDALVVVTSGLVLSDYTKFGRDVTVESLAQFNDDIVEQVKAAMSVLSEMVVTDEATTGASFMAQFNDTMTVLPEPSYTVAAMIELLDSANFTAHFSLPGNDGGLYVGYAMNIRNAGMVKYENYPFVGFGVAGGLALAIGEEGLYTLEGDDDAGEPIHSLIRTGLTDYGSSVLKKVPNSYIGYRSDGSLVMKVITTDGGRKKENWYALKPRQAEEPVENRFDIAKGLVGLYWGYKVENLDGADFELDIIKMWPFMVQRRKSGR